MIPIKRFDIYYIINSRQHSSLWLNSYICNALVATHWFAVNFHDRKYWSLMNILEQHYPNMLNTIIFVMYALTTSCRIITQCPIVCKDWYIRKQSSIPQMPVVSSLILVI